MLPMKYKIALTFPWELNGTYWLASGQIKLVTEESAALHWNADIIDSDFIQSLSKDFGRYATINLIPVI